MNTMYLPASWYFVHADDLSVETGISANTFRTGGYYNDSIIERAALEVLRKNRGYNYYRVGAKDVRTDVLAWSTISAMRNCFKISWFDAVEEWFAATVSRFPLEYRIMCKPDRIQGIHATLSEHFGSITVTKTEGIEDDLQSQ